MQEYKWYYQLEYGKFVSNQYQTLCTITKDKKLESIGTLGESSKNKLTKWITHTSVKEPTLLIHSKHFCQLIESNNHGLPIKDYDYVVLVNSNVNCNSVRKKGINEIAFQITTIEKIRSMIDTVSNGYRNGLIPSSALLNEKWGHVITAGVLSVKRPILSKEYSSISVKDKSFLLDKASSVEVNKYEDYILYRLNTNIIIKAYRNGLYEARFV